MYLSECMFSTEQNCTHFPHTIFSLTIAGSTKQGIFHALRKKHSKSKMLNFEINYEIHVVSAAEFGTNSRFVQSEQEVWNRRMAKRSTSGFVFMFVSQISICLLKNTVLCFAYNIQHTRKNAVSSEISEEKRSMLLLWKQCITAVSKQDKMKYLTRLCNKVMALQVPKKSWEEYLASENNAKKRIKIKYSRRRVRWK